MDEASRWNPDEIRALVESSAGLGQILHSVPDGVLVVDLERRILYVNDQFAKMYGTDASEMLGRFCYEIIGFDHCRDCPHAGVTGEGDAYTGHSLRCDRVPTGPYCVSASPYHDPQGELIGMVEIYRDMKALGAYIDDIERSNRELHFERQRLDDILSASADGYFTAGADRMVLGADDKLLRLLGKSRDEVVGRPCPEVFCSDKCETDCPISWAVENDENVLDCHERIVAAEGEIPVDKSVFLHKTPDGELDHVIGVLRNASEILALRRDAHLASSFERLVSRNPRMEEVFDRIRTFGPTDTTVLILGESGTGKELVARALQQVSPRRDARFLKINCSALAEGILESELFGHVRGAFTGATQDKRGLFEVADGGTLFLDEVGDMSPNLQTKLLRVLEEQEFEKVGGTETLRVDVRVITATNRNLQERMAQGLFREDLYYRLNTIQIKLPPLRERREDIPLLVDHMLGEVDQQHGRGVRRISARALELLLHYEWPGNIRELRNAIEFAYVCSRGDRIERQDLPETLREEGFPAPPDALAMPHGGMIPEEDLRATLRRFGGNRQKAAQALGISRTTLWRRLKELEQESKT